MDRCFSPVKGPEPPPLPLLECFDEEAAPAAEGRFKQPLFLDPALALEEDEVEELLPTIPEVEVSFLSEVDEVVGVQ